MSGRPDPKKREKLLAFLRAHFSAYDYSPSFMEMKVGAELSSTCIVKKYLKELARDGLIQMQPGMPRTVRLTEKGRGIRPQSAPQPQPVNTRAPRPAFKSPAGPQQRVAAYVSKVARINADPVGQMVHLPVIARITAGAMTPVPNNDFSIYDPESTIEVSEDVLPSPAKRDYYFVLEVSGDSMIEAGIFDGDYVICRKTETAQNSEMVVALLPDVNETTLKYFFKESDRIRLQPANSKMLPIYIDDTTHLVIQGVVVQVVHCRDD